MKNILFAVLSLLTGTLILFFPTSCKKTVTRIVTDTVKPAWQQFTVFNSEGMPALSSANIGDTILAIGGSQAYFRIPVNQPGFIPIWGQSLTVGFFSPTAGAPYMDASLCSYATSTGLYVKSDPVYSQYSTLIYTPVFTPGAYNEFVQQAVYPTFASPAAPYPVIRDRYVITPVEAVGNTNQQVRFDLISFDSAQVLGPNGFGDTPHIKQVILDAAPGTIGVTASDYFCAIYYDKFFVQYGGQFFRLDTAGNSKAFGYFPVAYSRNYGIANMFTYGNTLYINSGGVIVASTDEGETWSLVNDYSQTSVGQLTYRNVGDGLYATATDLDSQLWKVVISGNNFSFSELINDGLQYNLITSLTRCGRYVFATSPTGIFYRDTASFNQLKTP